MIRKAHCLFEQSGTFKNEFIKLGIPAEDYDILNDFGQTDHQIDLFGEINTSYGGGISIFDNMTADDVIMAFFPCTKFEDQTKMLLCGNSFSQVSWDDERKINYSISQHTELHEYYMVLAKLMLIAIRDGLRMVIENPYSPQHYLTNYFPVKPAIVDKDRMENGDYYKKPTQYWFIGFAPKQNFIFESLEYVPPMKVSWTTQKHFGLNRTIARSMIHPQYARRFIKMYLLDPEQVNYVQ